MAGNTRRDGLITVRVGAELVLGKEEVEQDEEEKEKGPSTAIPTIPFTARSSCYMTDLRDKWEATSFALEMLQANPLCVEQEQRGMASRKGPSYSLTFDPTLSIAALTNTTSAATATANTSFSTPTTLNRKIEFPVLDTL